MTLNVCMRINYYYNRFHCQYNYGKEGWRDLIIIELFDSNNGERHFSVLQ